MLLTYKENAALKDHICIHKTFIVFYVRSDIAYLK